MKSFAHSLQTECPQKWHHSYAENFCFDWRQFWHITGLVTTEDVLTEPDFVFSGTKVIYLHFRESVTTGSELKLSGNFCFVPDKVKYTVSNFRTLYLTELVTLSSRFASIRFGVLLLVLISDIYELPIKIKITRLTLLHNWILGPLIGCLALALPVAVLQVFQGIFHLPFI